MAPGAAEVIGDTLTRSLVSFQDRTFLDPLAAPIVGKQPATIRRVNAGPATGNLVSDVDALLDMFFAARPGADDNVALIANAAKAGKIRRLHGGGGAGYPVLVTAAAGSHVIVVDGSGLYYADGGVVIDISRDATLQMNDAPVNPADPATSVWTAMFQDNQTAYRVERFLNWFAVPTSVAYLAGA